MQSSTKLFWNLKFVILINYYLEPNIYSLQVRDLYFYRGKLKCSTIRVLLARRKVGMSAGEALRHSEMSTLHS
jgi:hypothetical protein